MHSNVSAKMPSDPATLAAGLLVGLVRGTGVSVPTLRNTELPTRGYIVGGVVAPLIVERESVTYSTLEHWVSVATYGITDEGFFVGAWEDEGKIYFDLSEHYLTREIAVAVGKIRGELAIWDIENQCDIRLDDALATAV